MHYLCAQKVKPNIRTQMKRSKFYYAILQDASGMEIENRVKACNKAEAAEKMGCKVSQVHVSSVQL